MPADPLDALRLRDAPLAPDRAFAVRVRARLEAALGRTPPGGAMSNAHPDQSPTTLTPRQTLTIGLCVHDTRRAIEWYQDILGATPASEPIIMDDGRVGHAELRFGSSLLYLADEFPEIGVVSPRGQQGSSAYVTIEVPDVDDTYARALAAGAAGEREPADQFYGARAAFLVDPFGHRWSIQTPLASQT